MEMFWKLILGRMEPLCIQLGYGLLDCGIALNSRLYLCMRHQGALISAQEQSPFSDTFEGRVDGMIMTTVR